MSPDFQPTFETAPFKELDNFALLARQDYNLGGTGEWFGEFRRGLYAFYARLYGVSVHYSQIHAWLPYLRGQIDTEYHLGSIFFCMDSALECFAFALNALGYAAYPTDFRDVTTEQGLRDISPDHVRGISRRGPPPPGYAKVFPRLQQYWNAQVSVIAEITDLHDVSKHRGTIFSTGQGRLDPPDGFLEALGAKDDPVRRALLMPMETVRLRSEPKLPAGFRTLTPGRPLEDLVPEFAAFINKTGELALEDVQSSIVLKESEFRAA